MGYRCCGTVGTVSTLMEITMSAYPTLAHFDYRGLWVYLASLLIHPTIFPTTSQTQSKSIIDQQSYKKSSQDVVSSCSRYIAH